MRAVVIDEAAFENAAQLHAYLKRELHFPAYYGANLDALNDCAEDIDTPTHIMVLRRTKPDGRRWFDRVIMVLERCATANPDLTVRNSMPDTLWD